MHLKDSLVFEYALCQYLGGTSESHDELMLQMVDESGGSSSSIMTTQSSLSLPRYNSQPDMEHLTPRLKGGATPSSVAVLQIRVIPKRPFLIAAVIYSSACFISRHSCRCRRSLWGLSCPVLSKKPPIAKVRS